MRREFRIIVILSLVLWSILEPVSSGANALDRLRKKIPVDPIVKVSPAQLAGQYTSTPEELGQRVGPFLAGSDLYLFPNGTYIYCEWKDIEPVTIFDKGTWSLVEGSLELKADQEVTWRIPNVQRKYLLVHRASYQDEVLLVGMEHDLPYFEKHAGHDPELMLLIVARARVRVITEARSSELKTKIMREAWRPQYFTTAGSKN